MKNEKKKLKIESERISYRSSDMQLINIKLAEETLLK